MSYAKSYIDDTTLDSTVNRIYYAMFDAVNALLVTKGLYSSKHSALHCGMRNGLVKCGKFTKTVPLLLQLLLIAAIN